MRRLSLSVSAWGQVLILLTGSGVGILSAAMFNYREYCEPVLRLVLPVLAGRKAHFRYNPDDYFFWAGLAAFFAAALIAAAIFAALRQPAENRRVEKALRSRSQAQARGAPLEPK